MEIVKVISLTICIAFSLFYKFSLWRVKHYGNKNLNGLFKEPLIKIEINGNYHTKVSNFIWNNDYDDHEDDKLKSMCSKAHKSAIFGIVFGLITFFLHMFG